MPARPDLLEELLALADDEGGGLDALDALVIEHGWPGLRLVGADGADTAWMLAHRATDANDRRRALLPALRQAVETGDADPRHLATLADAIAAADGLPQPYGTIATLAADGEPEFLHPLEDPAGLDARRAAIRLPSFAADAPYLAAGIVPYGPERGSFPVNQWPMIVEGHVSVEAVLAAGVRPVHRIWATRPGDRRFGRLRALARERGVLIDQVAASVIDELAQGSSHGGVIGLCGARRPRSMTQLLTEVGDSPFIVMLDGIEDPFNFGQAVRALFAAGVDGLVVRRSWETALATVTRSSGGATELLPTASVRSAVEAIDAARASGLRIVIADAGGDATDQHALDLRGGLFLLIGGERRGVTRSLREAADVRLRIVYGRERAPALGTAAAAAVIGFEALRQRRSEDPPPGEPIAPIDTA